MSRLRRLTGVLAVALVALTGCDAMPRPTGDSPLRYRDRVFDEVSVTRDIRYGTAPDNDGQPVALTLDLYKPVDDSAAARPVLVWAHGGGFSTGDKDSTIAVTMATEFAKRGYVTASIDYRLLAPPGCTGATAERCTEAAIAAIHDAQAAVRWLRANFAEHRIDRRRIAIGGESAGAIMATGVGVWADEPGDSGNPGFPSDVQGWISISGGVPGGSFVDRRDAPGLLFAGTDDGVVPHQWSVETTDAMRRNGVLAVFKSLEGAGHVPWGQYRGLFITQTSYFLYHVMDLRQASQ
ncbi:MAG: alpha/beta hydrolase [Actinomycetota bacterium]